MTINHRFNIPSFVLAAVLSMGFSCKSLASQDCFVIDTRNGVWTQLPLDGLLRSASDINNAGQVTGDSGFFHAFITGPNAEGMTFLGWGEDSMGFAINEAGQVTGQILHLSETEVGFHAFITGTNGEGIRDLGTFGGTTSSGYGINEFGQVAGFAATANDTTHALLPARTARA